MRASRPLLARLGIVGGTRLTKVAWTVATVLVLAFVIYGVAAVSAPKKDDRATSGTLTAKAEANKLFGEALASEKRGDMERAETLAKSVLALDADNDDAKQLLDRVKNSGGGDKKSDSKKDDSSDGKKDDSADSPDVDKGYTEPIEPLTSLLPKTVKGYRLGAVDDAGQSVILPLQPNGAADGISSGVMTVIDSGSTKEARSYVSGLDRAGYTLDRKDVKVGDMTAKYGRDSFGHASVVYSRGRYTFEVVATLVDPEKAGIDGAVASIAVAFPSAKL